MDKDEILEGYRDERQRFIGFLRTIDAAAWDTPSLCEGWRVRDIAAHLAGNVADVLEQRLEGAGSVEYNQRQVDERAGMTPAEILAEWEDKGAQLDAFLAGLDATLWDTELPQIGMTVGFGVLRLLEDLWVHAQDARGPLGHAPEPGPGLTATLETVAHELPARARAFAPGVGRVEIAAGDFLEVAVGDGSALRIEGDPATIALAATGRVRLDRALADGRVKITPPPPDGFADALNVYGPKVP